MEMKSPFNSPGQLLAYRSLKQLLALKPAAVHTVAPTDYVLTALRVMADNRIGVARLDVPERLPPGARVDPPQAKI